MKSSNIIYGTRGILAALAGGGLVLQSFSFLAFMPWGHASFGFLVLALAGGYLFLRGLKSVRCNFDEHYRSNPRNLVAARITIEDRLDELERLKRRAMVTPEEYETKRKDILNDL